MPRIIEATGEVNLKSTRKQARVLACELARKRRPRRIARRPGIAFEDRRARGSGHMVAGGMRGFQRLGALTVEEGHHVLHDRKGAIAADRRH